MSAPMKGPSGKSGNKVPSGYKVGQVQQFTPEMMEFLQHLMDQLGPDSFMGKIAGGDEEAFAEMEAPALRQFSGVQGNIASRFSGMGMGGRRSSGFTNTMNKASSDFAQDLQGKRTDMRMNAIKEMIGMGNQVLQNKPYEQQMIKKKKSFIDELMGSFGENFGDIAKEGIKYAATAGGA